LERRQAGREPARTGSEEKLASNYTAGEGVVLWTLQEILRERGFALPVLNQGYAVRSGTKRKTGPQPVGPVAFETSKS